ncbi:MAG: type II toxin-antitoxin system RelE family toxin [Spirochaetota bacterium]
MFKIKLADYFKNQLRKMDKKTIGRLLKKIYNLKQGYRNNNNVKHLTNYSPEYRLRVGDYRILFDVKNDVIYIQEIRTRGKGY